jgi:hypothetical protein
LSPEHLVSEALRLLIVRDKHEQELTALREDIEAGWDEAELGQLHSGPETMRALLELAENRLK